MKNYRAILVGNGTMGKRHRLRFETSGVEFVCTIDSDCENLADEQLDCLDFAVVASPATTHYKYVRFFLSHKVPVLVEKPLATSVAEAQGLLNLSKQYDTLLFVAHSECYNPLFLDFRRRFLRDVESFRACCENKGMKSHCNEGICLEFRREHGHSERCHDVDVSHDLLVHDLSLFLNMFCMKDIRVVEKNLGTDESLMRLRVVRGPYAGIEAFFYVNRESHRDVRTVSALFPKAGYTASLVNYDTSLNVMHISDSLDNEHRFFLRLLNRCSDKWALRAAESAVDVLRLIES